MSAITSFTPVAAYAGDAVILTGDSFTGATSVQFGGVDADSFVVVDDTTIIAIVGFTGATGEVDMTSPGGMAGRVGFTFLGLRPVGSKVKMQNSPAYPTGSVPADNDLVWVLDTATNVLRKAKLSDLPGTGGGGGGDVTNLGSPFAVRVNDDNYAYDAGTNSVTITDVRLLGKVDYPIAATQLNSVDFEDEQKSYDPDNGKVTISNFQLDDGEKLWITCAGVLSTALSDFLASMSSQLALINQILAVFKPTALGPTGARVWWMNPIDEIPDGWEIDTDMAGYFPMAQDADDEDFGIEIGTAGGAKEFGIEMANLPAEGIDLHVITGHRFSGGSSNDGVVVIGAGTEPEELETASDVQTADLGDGTDIKFLNPFKVGVWIKFSGS